MKHTIKVISIKTDNPKKNYLIKKYTSHNYYINQSILGKVFYKTWTRVRKADALELLFNFNKGIEKHINLTYKLEEKKRINYV